MRSMLFLAVLALAACGGGGGGGSSGSGGGAPPPPLPPPAPALPDLVVDSFSISPASPVVGDSVSFSCVVRNAGTTTTPFGVVIGVGYIADGTQVSWGSVPGPLAPGATVTIGTQGGTVTATSGTHTLVAFVDDVNRILESNENNNALAITVTVGSTPPPPGSSGPPPDYWDPNLPKSTTYTAPTVASGQPYWRLVSVTWYPNGTGASVGGDHHILFQAKDFNATLLAGQSGMSYLLGVPDQVAATKGAIDNYLGNIPMWDTGW